MIRLYKNEDLDVCADLLISAYNGYPWECHWTTETAKRYLSEICSFSRFVGFVIFEGDTAVGAAFCREKTWWTDDELFCEELFISPNFQRKGYGKKMLQHMEQYVNNKKLAGITLLTNRYMPASAFYAKNNFCDAEHVKYMYKIVPSENY